MCTDKTKKDYKTVKQDPLSLISSSFKLLSSLSIITSSLLERLLPKSINDLSSLLVSSKKRPSISHTSLL